MTELTRKTILITGATGGFGQEFAKQLFNKGNRLILTDLAEEALQAQAKTLQNANGSGQIMAVIATDLSTAAGAQALFEAVMACEQPLDILLNNAGLALVGRHDEVPQAAWEQLMRVNLLAPMRLCAMFAPQMIEQGSGHIVNIASLASWMSSEGLTAYAASKFGLRGFSETLTAELAEYGVRVTTVYPYYSRTPIINSPRYGIMNKATSTDQANQHGLTDPADVVAETILAIEQDAERVFPDKTARVLYRVKRYAPLFFNILRRWV